MIKNEEYISKMQDFQILKVENSEDINNNFSIYKVKRILDNQIYMMYQFKLNDYWGKLISSKKCNTIANKINKIASLKSNYIVYYRDSFIDKISNSFILITDYYTDTLYNNIIMKHFDINRNISEENIIKYIFQIAHALNQLHNINIYNINLNSINIYIDKDNNLRLNPFNDIISHDELINNNDNPIVSPELINEKVIFSEKSDIWYFGHLIYEMCCLKKMKRKFIEDLNKMYSYIIKNEYEQIRNCYSIDISNIIKGCLQFSEKRRLSAKEIENKMLKLKEKKIVNKKIEEFKLKKKWEKKPFLKIKTLDDYNQNYIKNQNFKNKIPINKSNTLFEKKLKNPLKINYRNKPLKILNNQESRLIWNGKLYFSRSKTPTMIDNKKNISNLNGNIYNKINIHNNNNLNNINDFNNENSKDYNLNKRNFKRFKSYNNINYQNLTDFNNENQQNGHLNNQIVQLNNRNINNGLHNHKYIIRYQIRYQEEINYPQNRIIIPPLRINEINKELKRNNSVNYNINHNNKIFF